MQRQGKIMAVFAVAMLALFALLMSKIGKNMEASTERSVFTEEDAALRFPYQTLNEKERALYETLYEAMTAHRANVKLPHEYTEQEYARVYLMVLMQEPQFFYVSGYYQLAPVMRDTEIQYEYDSDTAQSMKQEMDAAADEILDGMKANATDWEKILHIHDEIAERCTYRTFGDVYSAYGCLVNGAALCEGYGKAFTYLARRAGLDVMCVPGKAADGEKHLWNIIKMDGIYYNVDVTWDDSDNLRGAISHQYLAVPDERFTKHIADTTQFEPPVCATNCIRYYQERGLILGDSTQASAKIGDWVSVRQKDCVEFYCVSPTTYIEVMNKLESDTEIGNAVAPYTGGKGSFIGGEESQIITIIF